MSFLDYPYRGPSLRGLSSEERRQHHRHQCLTSSRKGSYPSYIPLLLLSNMRNRLLHNADAPSTDPQAICSQYERHRTDQDKGSRHQLVSGTTVAIEIGVASLPATASKAPIGAPLLSGPDHGQISLPSGLLVFTVWPQTLKAAHAHRAKWISTRLQFLQFRALIPDILPVAARLRGTAFDTSSLPTSHRRRPSDERRQTSSL
ncbi:hypothetical protein PMIN01_13309 [Paraphaeosphaeria minitans]|uniref:Uncharacterized protein n=1 Tax=Paraphaeosphaeria minitans TaxID=565426 RepID=A0A9P6G718_9PLEO|nr:hypothetical protein PMIN01_13309 [Paraphaeosphaeria minitans]